MLTLLFSLCAFIVSLTLRLAHRLRLTLPLLYAAVMGTLLRSWYQAHTMLACGIFYAMLAAVALSWLVTLCRAILDAAADRAEESAAIERFAERVRQARASGESVVSTVIRRPSAHAPAGRSS